MTDISEDEERAIEISDSIRNSDQLSDEQFDEVIGLLQSENEEVRKQLISSLDELDDPSNHDTLFSEITPLLLECLDTEDDELREGAAILLLTMSRSKPSVLIPHSSSLVDHLYHSDHQFLIADTISNLCEREPSILDPIQDRLDQADESTLKDSLTVLRHVENQDERIASITPQLLEILEETDDHEVVSTIGSIVWSLSIDSSLSDEQLGRAIELFAEHLQTDSGEVRAAALETLGKLGPKAPTLCKAVFPDIVDCLDSSESKVRLAALGTIDDICTGGGFSTDLSAGGLVAFYPILERLDDEDPEVRARALSTINSIGISHSEPIGFVATRITKCLDDEEEAVRDEAVEVLNRISEDEPESLAIAVPILAEIISEKIDTEAEEVTDLSGGVAADAAATLSPLLEAHPGTVEPILDSLLEHIYNDKSVRRQRAFSLLPEFVEYTDTTLTVEDRNEILSAAIEMLKQDGKARWQAADHVRWMIDGLQSTTESPDEFDEYVDVDIVERCAEEVISILLDDSIDFDWNVLPAIERIAKIYPDKTAEVAPRIVELTEKMDKSSGMRALIEIAETNPGALVSEIPQLEAILQQKLEEESDESVVGGVKIGNVTDVSDWDAAKALMAVGREYPHKISPAFPALLQVVTESNGWKDEDIREGLVTIASEAPSQIDDDIENLISILSNHMYDSLESQEKALEALSDLAAEYPEDVAVVTETVADVLVDYPAVESQSHEMLEGLSSDPDIDLWATSVLKYVSLERETEKIEPAVSTLGKLAKEGTRAEYSNLTGDAQQAADTLTQLNSLVVLGSIARDDPDAVLEALGSSFLIDLLENDREEFRLAAIRAIASIAITDGTHRDIVQNPDRFESLLEDSEEGVRYYTCLIIAEIEATEHTASVAKLAKSDPDPDVREVASVARDMLRGEPEGQTDIGSDRDKMGEFMPDDTDEKYSL